MKVLRIQGQNGYGPYYDPPISLENHLKYHNCDLKNRPTPQNDINGRWIEDHEYCGFSNLNQLKSWFNCADRRALADNLYEITVWDCPDDLADDIGRQVLFQKEKSYMVGKFNMRQSGYITKQDAEKINTLLA